MAPVASETKQLVESNREWFRKVKAGKGKGKDLKAFLKQIKLPQTGDVVDMGKRILLFVDVVQHNLLVSKGSEEVIPFALNNSQLQKALADRGLSPIGDKDELISRLVENMKAMKCEGNKSDLAETNDGSKEDEDVALAKEILKMESSDYGRVLSILGDKITAESSIGAMRKAYLKISLKIHPDKLQSRFKDATKSFQILVSAYERLSQPELFSKDEDKDTKKKAKSLARSNQGCYRTKLFCPRCRSEWGLPISGVEKYDYNWMMMGLKMYSCCTCLFSFGCMTATHECPYCHREFEYHPNDYHRKIKCSSARCNKDFGFFMFNVSQRREEELRRELRSLQESRLKAREAVQRRERRARERQGGGLELDASEEEKAYVMGLVDKCPRCGDEEENEDKDRRSLHLTGCKDKKKIASYQAKLKTERKRKADILAAKERDEDVQGLQAWEFLGGEIGTMWTLSEGQLRTICEQYQLDVNGDRETLLKRIGEHRRSLDSSKMLTGGEKGSTNAGSANKRVKIDRANLPANMESMTYEQLRAVCMSQGIVARSTTKKGIIKEIEKAAYDEEEHHFMLEYSKEKEVPDKFDESFKP